MEYNSATREGRGTLLIIGLLERTIKNIKQKAISTTKTQSLKKIITKSNSHHIKPKRNN